MLNYIKFHKLNCKRIIVILDSLLNHIEFQLKFLRIKTTVSEHTFKLLDEIVCINNKCIFYAEKHF